MIPFFLLLLFCSLFTTVNSMYLLFFSLNNITFLPIKKEIKECEKEIKEGRGGGVCICGSGKCFTKILA